MLEHNKKYTFRFGDRKIVFNKTPQDADFHVYAKALVFALYHKQYRSIRVEPQLEEQRFQPDLCAFDIDGMTMTFWAEVGNVSLDKIEKLFKKYRRAHFVFVKQERDVTVFQRHLTKIGKEVHTFPLIDIVVYPEHFQDWNVSDEGDVYIRKEDVQIIRWNEPEDHVNYY